MPPSLDSILNERSQRLTNAERSRSVFLSLVLHLMVIALVWGWPKLFAEPPKEFEFVSVVVIPPTALGVEQPPPPPPKPPPPKPPPPKPPPPQEPEPVLEDVPVLKTEKPKEEVAPPPPPEPAPVAPPPPTRKDPPKRRGNVFGDPLGVSNNNATLGVEDPNFTYGYYLNQVLAQISRNWLRPPVGGEIKQAVIYFRIERQGGLNSLRIAEPSGSERFDQAALRAVESSAPLPPLPRGYKEDSLGINLIVR